MSDPESQTQKRFMPVAQRVSLNDSMVSEQSAPQSTGPIIVPQSEKELKDAKADVAHYSKRLRVTSIILGSVGAIMALGSLHYGFTARNLAERIIWGHHHNRTEGAHPHPHHVPDHQMTYSEFAIIDLFKTMCFLSFVSSICMMCMGKKGMMVIWK